jgi:hypothetical protein
MVNAVAAHGHEPNVWIVLHAAADWGRSLPPDRAPYEPSSNPDSDVTRKYAAASAGIAIANDTAPAVLQTTGA